ncbi:chloramphenicol 3-O-phosphotransferase [Corynebacterium mustelae]|uniref:Chloramphenicol 3-O-phosphotransferase n=1 Tax=Corynebacterium mustelae TaxID=571915 RepID=A0A0G3H1A8_9CORY|nr:hypothetical protein [Corynebacterium mustelae]AKK07166.1 chloramphenicol 3-O-phosphotransferase [Corynebacterium mustelae]
MIVVINGPSSCGKTSAAAALTNIAPGAWLRFSIDDFINALPPKLVGSPAGLMISETGTVSTGATFHMLFDAWLSALGHLARTSVHIVYDDVFLDPITSKRTLSQAFSGNDIVWVALECSPDELARREASRGDRPAGMATSQLSCVDHRYTADIRLTTDRLTPEQIARKILGYINYPE